MAEPALLDTITAAGLEHAGRVTLVASHGALHVAALASRARLRAVILSDAGIGLDRAGVAGVEALGAIGMAAAAADVRSARIGDAADMRARGRLSLVNGPAAALGCASGDAVHEALVLLAGAPEPQGRLDDPSGGRAEIALLGGGAVLLDSASLMEPEDAGRIVVTGSHGAAVVRRDRETQPATKCPRARGFDLDPILDHHTGPRHRRPRYEAGYMSAPDDAPGPTPKSSAPGFAGTPQTAYSMSRWR